jgi:malate dehydrogenase (oxaloacetate-decarboxylating)
VVAEAVGKQAIAEGLAELPNGSSLEEELKAYVWEPVYVPYKRVVGD